MRRSALAAGKFARRRRTPPFLMLVLCSGLAQILLVALIVLLCQIPGRLVPAILLGVPIVALLVHADDGVAGALTKPAARWLRRGAFLLVSCAALAAPGLLPWIAAAALATAAGYWTWTLLGPPWRRGRSALIAWLVLFAGALAALSWLGAGPATIAAVVLAFCFAETINLLLVLSRIVRRSQRIARTGNRQTNNSP